MCGIVGYIGSKNAARGGGSSLFRMDRLYIKASSRWQVGPAPLPSPTQKPLDPTEYGQMCRS